MSRKTELAKERRKIRLENGCCARCGKKNDRIGYYYCSECATKHNEYTREARKFYREIGVCTVCGKNKVFGSERICLECRLKQQERREQKPQSEEQRLKDNATRSKGARKRYSERAKRVSVQGAESGKLSQARRNADNALTTTLLSTASGILTSPIQGNTGLKIDSATTVDSH